MKKITIIMIFLLISLIEIYAVTAPDIQFPIAAYQFSYPLKIPIDTLAIRMRDAGFNMCMDVQQREIAQFNLFREYGIEPIPVVDEVGVRRLSGANYWEYEAEYITNESAKIQFSDRWPKELPYEIKWYQTRNGDKWNHRQNLLNSSNLEYDSQLPSHFSLKYSNKMKPEYMLKQILKLFYSTPTDSIMSSGFSLDRRGGIDTIFVRPCFKLTPNQFQDSQNIIRVGLKVLYQDSSTKQYVYINIPLVSSDSIFNTYETEDEELVVTKQNIKKKYGYVPDSYFTLTFKASVKQIPVNFSQITIDGIFYNSLELVTSTLKQEICAVPTIYYCGVGDVYLDYVAMFDNKYLSYKKNPSENKSIKLRLDMLNKWYTAGFHNFSLYDEPSPAQLFIQNEIYRSNKDKPDLKLFQSMRPIYSNTSRWHIRNYNYIADRLMVFKHSKTMLSQYYPTGLIRNWNQLTPKEWNVLDYWQSRLSIMCSYYKELREYCSQNEASFYPVVQCYGQYYMDTHPNSALKNTWVMIRPPKISQKVLSYLPLCYNADGLFYYTFTNAILFDDQMVQSAPFNIFSGNYSLAPNYQSLAEAHAKIKQFVPILKSLNWDKDRVYTLMPTEQIINLSECGLGDVSVYGKDLTGLSNRNPRDPESYNEGYDGFIECAVYSSKNENYLFLVNRRADFAKNKICTEGALNNNLGIENFDSKFVKAEDQAFRINKVYYIANNYCLFDMLTQEVYELNTDVPIQAGDARLFKLCNVVDTIIKTDKTFENVLINHKIVIKSGATLKLTSKNIFLNDSLIKIEKGGKLVLSDSENIMSSGCKILNKGSLIIQNSKLTSKDGTWKGIESSSNAEEIITNSEIK